MKGVRAGRPVTAGDVTVIPLERVIAYSASGRHSLRAYLSMEPFGIVLCTRQKRWAVDIHGENMPLETCIQEIEGLQEVLDHPESAE